MKRFVKTAVAIALLPFAASTYAAGTTANTMTPEQRAQIESVVHDYILQKPEVLMEALQILQKKQYEQAEQTVKKTQKDASQFADALFRQPNDPVAGNPQGKVTVTEFFDYQCPHCVDMAPVIEAIIKANPDVRIVFKEFPIRGPLSELAAKTALAANKQGKYYQFSHALLQNKQPLSKEVIMQVAKNAGVNMEQLQKDIDDKSVEAQLKSNIKLAQDLKLFGTPAFFIGKTDAKGGGVEYIPGQMDQAQMQDQINKAK